MDEFIKKWKKDSKYRTKIKLLVYTLFIISVSVYAISINSNFQGDNNNQNNEISDIKEDTNQTSKKNILDIPDNYKEIIKIKIDNDEFEYIVTKNNNKENIVKYKKDEISNYIYENNKYYKLIDDNYFVTSSDEVYDIINYNYINLLTINEYLKKATNDNQQYVIYLKDIILGIDSDEYFIIIINNNKINIDYTPLMKYFNKNINQCIVEILIEKE